jgi:hypothetical protein
MPETVFKGSQLAKARSQVAVAHRKKDPQAIQAARQDFAAAKIEAYIEKTLAAAPELEPEQLTKLAELLKPVRIHARGGDVDGAA